MAMITTRTVDQTTLRTRLPATIMLDSSLLLQVKENYIHMPLHIHLIQRYYDWQLSDDKL